MWSCMSCHYVSIITTLVLLLAIGVHSQTTRYYATTVAGGNVPQLSSSVPAKDTTLFVPYGIYVTSKNELFIGEYYGNRVRKMGIDNMVTTVAGSGRLGYEDYSVDAKMARFKYIADIKYNETSGELFIADLYNQAIRKVYANGTLTTIGGGRDSGYLVNNVQAKTATIGLPQGIALLNGDVYISDTEYDTIGKISSDGIYSIVAGVPGSYGFNNDGLAKVTKLYNPRGIAFNSKQELYIMDCNNLRIRKLLNNGTIVTVAGTGRSGAVDGVALSATISASTFSIAIDMRTNIVYFTDLNRIRRLVNDSYIETIAGSSSEGFSVDGTPAKKAILSGPRGIALDSNGNILFSDTGNNRVRMINATDANIYTICGSGSYGYVENGNATQAVFYLPYVYANEYGDLFIAENAANSVRKVNNSSIITTLAGTGVSGAGVSGNLAVNVKLSKPTHVSQRYNGDIFIADYGNNRLGSIDAISGIITFYTSWGGSTSFSKPSFTYWINSNEFLIVDSGNNRILQGSISGSLSILGSGDNGYLDYDSFAGSRFSGPLAAVTDSSRNIYVADYGNNLIRKAYTNGTVTTIAGVKNCTTYNGDGILATSACLYEPYSVAVNSIGEVFLIDGSHFRIRKIRTDGIIVTIAGTGIGEYNKASGDSLEVSIYVPRSISLLSNGDIYIGEHTNNLVRKLTPYCTQDYQYFNTTLQKCVCKKDGFYGDYCDQFDCFNYSYNSTLVCSGNGKCNSPNNCSCVSGYYGNSCASFNCSGIGCLNNGTCSGPSVCTCPQEYGGSRCEYLLCYGKTEVASTVCGGHGTCSSYNNCTCQNLWYSKDCSLTKCYSIPSNDSKVCGSKGTCIGPDTCQCNTGYDGTQCEHMLCYNKRENDSSVCSGHGKCQSPDNCACNYGFVGSNCQYYQAYLDVSNAIVYATDGPLLSFTTEFYNCSSFIGSTQLIEMGESDFIKCYWKMGLFRIYLGYGHAISDGSLVYFSNDVVLKLNANSSLESVKSKTLVSSINDVLSNLPQTQDVILMSNTDDYFHNFKNVKRVWTCTRCSTDISNRLALFVNKTMAHIPVSMMNSLSLDQSYLKSVDLVLDSTSSIGMALSDSDKSARVQPSTKNQPPSITWQGNNVKKSGYSCVGHNCIVEVSLNSLNTSISYTFSGFFSLLNSDFANKQMFRLVNLYGSELVDSEYSSNAQIYCFQLKTFVTLSYQYDFVYTTFDRLDYVLSNVNRTYSLNDISSIVISPEIDDPFITTFTVSDYLSYQYECYQIISSTDWTKQSGNLCSGMNSAQLTLNMNTLKWAQGIYLIQLNITVSQTFSTRTFSYFGWIELVSGASNVPTITYDIPPTISPSHRSLSFSAIVKSDSQVDLSWKLSGKLINTDGNELNIVSETLYGYSKKATLSIANNYLMEGESYTVQLSALNQEGRTNVSFTTRIDQTPRFSCSYWNLKNESNIAFETLLAISCFNLPNEPISAFQVEFYTSSGERINLVSNTFKKNIITRIPIYSSEEGVNLVVKLLNRYGSMSNITRSISLTLPTKILNATNTFNSRYSYVSDQFYILKRSEPLRVDTSSSINALLSILIQNSTVSQFVLDASSNLGSFQSMNSMLKEMISLLGSIDGITYKVEEKLVQLILPTISKLLSILNLTDSSSYVENQTEAWLNWIYSGMKSAKTYYSSLMVSQLLDQQYYNQIQTMHNILVSRYSNNLNKQQALKDFTTSFTLLTGYSPNNSSTMVSIDESEQLNGKQVQLSDNYGTSINLPSDLSSQLTSSQNIKLFYSSSSFDNDTTQGNILSTKPIIDISLFDSNGNALSVSNLNSPISIRFGELKTSVKDTLNISCIYYDSSLQSWSRNGIQTSYSIKRKENGYVFFSLECNTTHLSLFSARETILTPNQTSSSTQVTKSDDTTLIIILSTVIPVSVLFISAFVIVILILSCVIYKLKKKKQSNEIFNRTPGSIELDFTNDFPTESIFQPLSSISSNGKSSTDSSFNPMSRYLNLVRIGQGAFGSVFKVDDAKTSTTKAIKVMKFTSMEELNTIMKEGSQLMNVKHPNILKVNDFFVSKDQLLCIDMDFYELGDLQKFTKQDFTASELVVRKIIQQMCSALDYIHTTMNIIHRDIKPTNIFIKTLEKDDIHIIVADFGLAKANSGSIQNSYAGTPLYMSPELGFGANYSHNTDVYSLGVTMYQIMTKDMTTSISQLYVMKDQGEVKKIIRENLEKSPVSYSSKLIDIVISMIDKDPQSRPQARDILLKLQQ